ncbi:MAG: hypothetical protein ACK5PW_19755 [Burkholderiales bacterium]
MPSSPSAPATASAPITERSIATIAAWVARLPKERQPFALVRSYPRIAELLAGVDADTSVAIRYLDSLTIDDRGDRNGFPVDVGRELMQLRLHYAQRLEVEVPPDGGMGWRRGSRA